jgi:hypothetical protein
MMATTAPQEYIVTMNPGFLPAVLLAVLSLTACATDKSSDPRLSSVIHQCFRITGDAVLFETPNCPPLGGPIGTSTCVTIKYLSHFSPPVALSEFNADSHGAAASVAQQLTPRANGGPLPES